MFVQIISYLKMGQDFENTTFRFVNVSAVGSLRSCHLGSIVDLLIGCR